MSINPLNDISRVYLEQVAESAVPGKPAERLGAVTPIPQKERDAARERTLAKAAAIRAKKGIKTEALDPLGQEDADLNNNGIENDKSDRYLKRRRNAISKAISTQEALDPVGQEDADLNNNRIENDKSDKYLLNRRKVRGAAIAKKKSVKEGFSNWRQDLSEVISDLKDTDRKVKENSNINNKIEINPKLDLGEAVESLGGTLLEMIEIDEVDYIIESAYDELLEEGYDEDDIEEALDYALNEAKVTFGHDTAPEKKKSGLLAAARERLSGAVARGARKVAKGALGVARKMEGSDKTPSAAHTRTRTASTYRGAGAGQKEKVSSGSYQAPAKPKPKTPSQKSPDPWEGSATTPSKPQPQTKTNKPQTKTNKPQTKTNKPQTKTNKVSGGTPKPEPKSRRGQLSRAADEVLKSVHANESVNLGERTLTSRETAKKEQIFQGVTMDKLRKQYPEKSEKELESLRYAISTTMAKKIAEQALETPIKSQQTQQQTQQVQKQNTQNQSLQRQQRQRLLQMLRQKEKAVQLGMTDINV